MRTILTSLVLLAAALPQESRPSWESVRAELRSADPATAAWGAQQVSQYQMREAGPELGRLLRQLAKDWEAPERRALLNAVLDAVVQTGVRLPSEWLEPWATVPGFQVPVVLAASRAPRDFTRLIDRWLAEPRSAAVWAVACSLRAQEDPRKLVADVLGRVGIEVQVVVHTGFTVATSCGIGASLKPLDLGPTEGFPPPVWYRIVESPELEPRGARPYTQTVLCSKPRTWFAERAQAPPLDFFNRQLLTRVDATQFAFDAVQSLVTGGDWLQAASKIDHEWSGAEDYRSEIGGHVSSLRARWKTLLDALVARRLLDASTASAAEPRFQVEVRDLRVDRSVKLPELK